MSVTVYDETCSCGASTRIAITSSISATEARHAVEAWRKAHRHEAAPAGGKSERERVRRERRGIS